MKLFGLFFLPVGLFLLATTFWIYQREQAFYTTALRANGRVIELIRRRGSKGVTYAPRVVFTDTAGREVTFVSRVSSTPADYRVGEIALVAYPPNDSSRAEVDSFVARWLLVLILGGLGAIFSILGTAFFILDRRSQSTVPSVNDRR